MLTADKLCMLLPAGLMFLLIDGCFIPIRMVSHRRAGRRVNGLLIESFRRSFPPVRRHQLPFPVFNPIRAFSSVRARG